LTVAIVDPATGSGAGGRLRGGRRRWPGGVRVWTAGGGAADEYELVAPIERGLYVTRLSYVNPVRERDALLTGMTRDGTYLIEDGRITRPVRNARFTDGVLRLLAATETRRPPAPGQRGEFYGRRFATGVVCPPLRAAGFRVTGLTT